MVDYANTEMKVSCLSTSEGSSSIESVDERAVILHRTASAAYWAEIQMEGSLRTANVGE